MALTFIGLGLYDHRDISEKGLQQIRSSDHVFLECYTSCLTGTTIEKMESLYEKAIIPLSREDVETDPRTILDLSKREEVAFLTGGDPMVSTTHIDLRIRAAEEGITTRIIHGSSIISAVSGLTGLQNYRFGKSCSLPFPHGSWCPVTPAEVIRRNLGESLHTIVFLDIQKNRYMTVHDAVGILEDLTCRLGFTIPCYIGIARAGSEEPLVVAGGAKKLLETDFGGPLHILTIPGEFHVMEHEYLKLFAHYED
ncbi:MAG TPA: diphthine synthase [Methanoregulaceae archaeon]|nr:diphthine synthase [Methanoregulaceae archaeon]